MKPVIAVPYFPGSNGDHDAIMRIEEFGMKALPLYFHIGDEKRLEENASLLTNYVDGAVLPGGFPYQDRLGFGIVPSKINPFVSALRHLVDKGNPVIAFCSGNQIAHAMKLSLPENTEHKIELLPNIYDKDGKVVFRDFLDKKIHTKLITNPERTAFTRSYSEEEVIPDIIDNGGGRFWADNETLKYLVANDLIVAKYSDNEGNIIDNFPNNPNGSMLNIESVTNERGNLKLGMCHNERKLNALQVGRNNLVFESMKEYIEDKCPDLSSKAKLISPSFIDPSRDVSMFSYMSKEMNPENTIDIYIKMLTDDNEQNTAQLFLGEGVPLQRRKLIRLEVKPEYANNEDVQKIVSEIAKMDFFEGIMLKKDLPTYTMNHENIYSYEIVGKDKGTLLRDFKKQEMIVDNYPIKHEQVALPNPGGHNVLHKFETNNYLSDKIKNVHVGSTWFFKNEEHKTIALEQLL